METVVKSDVFFFITTMCVILVTIIVVVLGAYFIRIVSDVKYITKRAKKETDEIADDLKEARERLKEEGKGIVGFLTSMFAFGRARRKRREKGL